jgi:hypothetical protein
MKHNANIRGLFLVAFFSIPFLAVAEVADIEINMRIVENGVELSAPRMLVKEGSEASISLSGENPLALGLVVNSLDENKAYVLVEVETAANQISPGLIMTKGEWASVSVGELELHILVKDHAANQ